MKMGIEAIQHSGIQTALAQQLAEESKTLGVIALRAPEHPVQRYYEIASPKTMDIKEKTTNWGPMRGHVPVDALFTRVDQAGISMGTKVHGITSPEVYTVQEQKSLNLILSRVAENEYKIVDFDIYSGQLTFKVISSQRNKAFDGAFCIFLSEGISNTINEAGRYTREIDRPNETQDALHLKQLRELSNIGNTISNLASDTKLVNDWNASEFGPIEAAILNKKYPLYYIEGSLNSNLPKPVLIYADEHKRPFTSDWDTLWIGMPKTLLSPRVILSAKTPINSETPETLGYLNLAEKSLLDSLAQSQVISKSDNETFQNMLNNNASPKGIINPWEYFHLLLDNKGYRDNYISQLFQHGPENRTPFVPETLSNPCLHFVNGKIVLTENEAELLDLVQNKGKFQESEYIFMTENFIDVHPSWLNPIYSQYPERWAQIHKQQTESFSQYLVKNGLNDKAEPTVAGAAATTIVKASTATDVATIVETPSNAHKPPTLSITSTASKIGVIKTKIIPLDRFHIPKNLDFQSLHTTKHVFETLKPDQLKDLADHLLLKLKKLGN